MDNKIKESVATLLAHIIKVDNRDIEKEAPLFCDMMGQDFDCDKEEAKAFLTEFMGREHDMDRHVKIIKDALCEDKISKYHLMEQLNHIIHSDTIQSNDYLFFEKIQKELFDCD